MVLVMSVAGMAQLPADSFEAGNTAYNEGNYEQALTLYNSVVEGGMESASLYYNMGNTYYKMKDYPMSILYFEKALKLDPSNEDIRTNLEIANMAIVDKINAVPQSFIEKWWKGLGSAFSADGWAWLSIVAFVLLLVCLFAFLMSRRTGVRKAGFFIGLLAVLCLAPFCKHIVVNDLPVLLGAAAPVPAATWLISTILVSVISFHPCNITK